jgi:hypothetical protein
MTEQKNYLLAAEFLQNIVFINLQMNDEEKIQRFVKFLHKNLKRNKRKHFYFKIMCFIHLTGMNDFIVEIIIVKKNNV